MQPDHAVIVPPGGGVRFGNVEFLGLSEHSPRVNVSVITMAPGREGPETHVHRDEDRLPYADEYAPEIWDRPRDPAIVPFSGGPGVCPGRDLVLATGSAMLDALSEHLSFPTLSAPLPKTLNHFGLRMHATPMGTRVS